MVPLCIFTFLATIGFSHAVTIEASDPSPHLVRRETAPQSMIEVQTGSAGELRRGSSEKLSPQDLVNDVADQASPEGQDSCDWVFFDGAATSSNCTGGTLPADGERIQATSKCGDAARIRKFLKPNLTGDIKDNGYDETQHPQGCFWIACSEEPVKGCYFYNDVGFVPSEPVRGTPVCKRPKFKDGTIAANKDSECPTGYAAIVDRDQCHDMSKCMSYTNGVVFSITEHIHANELQYNDYPVGCFKDEPEGKVYFNRPPPDRTVAADLPTRPKGTPVCFLLQQ